MNERQLKYQLADEILALEDDNKQRVIARYAKGLDGCTMNLLQPICNVPLYLLQAIITEWKELKQWKWDNCGHDWQHYRDTGENVEYWSECSHCGKSTRFERQVAQIPTTAE